jgi:head-tail adaptor
MAKPVTGGELDKRITLLRATVAADAYGDDVPGFAPIATVPASKAAAPGLERLQSAEVAASAPAIFRIRWTTDLDPDAPSGLSPKDRLQYPPSTGRIYDIVAATEIGRHQGIEIVATTRSDK